MADLPNWKFRFEVPRPPEGEVVVLTAEQMEQKLLDQLGAAQDDPTQAMWALAQFYKSVGQIERAREQFRCLLDRTANLETKAQIVLALGQTAEKANDYRMAVELYSQALSLEPTVSALWYFIQNNLAYSLIQLERFGEAERYCRQAIKTDPHRPNAHKNLGLSLQGQGRYAEAAQAFVAATQANASDPRALGLLEALLVEHSELEFDFADVLEKCRKAVSFAAEKTAQAKANWRRRQEGEPK
jgi:tetratricopeptide (TPR) repeat protein